MLTPEHISKDIKLKAPYQQKAAGEAYIGNAVSWCLVFSSISEYEKFSGAKVFTVQAMYKEQELGFPYVSFIVDLVKYPQFKTAHADTLIWVKGTIKDAEPFHITLQVDEVFFSDPIKSQKKDRTVEIINNITNNITQVHNGIGDNLNSSAKKIDKTKLLAFNTVNNSQHKSKEEKWHQSFSSNFISGLLVLLIGTAITYLLGVIK